MISSNPRHAFPLQCSGISRRAFPIKNLTCTRIGSPSQGLRRCCSLPPLGRFLDEATESEQAVDLFESINETEVEAELETNGKETRKDSQAIIDDMKQRLRVAVKAEQQGQYSAIVDLYTKSSVAKLKESGNTITDLSISFGGNLFTSSKYKLSLSNSDLPFHRFAKRDPVLLTRMDYSIADGESAEKGVISGTVVDVSQGSITVVLDAECADRLNMLDLKKSKWRLDTSLRSATEKRQLEALDQIGTCTGTLPMAVIHAFIIGLDYPTSLVQNNCPPWVENERWRKESGKHLRSLTNLNHSQKLAVALSQKQILTLWQGPPGSGKTWTLLTLLTVVCLANRAVPEASTGPVLACADTNAAVDNIVEGLVKKNLRVVRVGNPAKVRDSLMHATLDGRAMETQWGQWSGQMQKEAEELDRLSLSRKAGSQKERKELKHRARQCRKEASSLMKKAYQEVLKTCEVVACTCNGAGGRDLNNMHFRMVIVDEATQSTEPATLVPLVQGVECLVMAGDPRQLPPTVISQTAVDAGLEVTLFDRLVMRGLKPRLLDTQYRMHPEISAFASQWFYGGKLKTGIDGAHRPVPKGIMWPNPEQPVLLVVCQGKEKLVNEMQSAPSYKNEMEAAMALRVLSHVLAPGDVTDVAILTPYRGQMTHLEKALKRCRHHFPKSAKIAISSVDAYQGREADVVIVSAVRCNPRRKLGFVSDARRLNVAITRPRRGLVVLGDPKTLASSNDWKAWLQWVRKGGCFIESSRIPPASWEQTRKTGSL
ncbi:hypothetical protein BSKO_02934 [Bryopsis sp. KO-2023]|nr:hypothetical protein BSKO_02934 [Bryopsis sp. KO-2023]